MFAVANGDQHVFMYGRGAAIQLHEFSDTRPAGIDALARQPSQLLLARNQVVRFSGRDPEMRRLIRWRNDETGAAIRLVHAPGGAGKTRLATEFARLSADHGWQVVRAALDEAGGATTWAIRPDAGGLLVVVDYAERWSRAALLALCADLPQPFRVLLLARHSQGWLTSLRHRLHERGVLLDIEKLAAPQNQREMFDDACASFAAIYRTNPAGLEPTRSFGENDSALSIQMAALAAVSGRTHGPASLGHTSYSDYLLARERDHWAALQESDHGRMLGRASFLATLFGPMARIDGIRLLRETRLAVDDVAAERILDQHQTCYPPTNDHTVLEPVAPDRLGEELVAQFLPSAEESSPGDSWASSALRFLLHNAVPPSNRARAIAVLAEAGRRWPHVRANLSSHLRGASHELVALGAATISAILAIADIPLLEQIESLLPDHDLNFDMVAAQIAGRLIAHRLRQGISPRAKADLHLDLGTRLGRVGDDRGAREATRTAVAIYRTLVAESRTAHEAGLANALRHLGTHLATLGEPSAALAATRESVALLEDLARHAPDRHKIELACALSNLAIDLRRVGALEEATRSAARAVAIFDGVRPTPATRHNYAMLLAESGRLPEAVEAMRRAVHEYRVLAGDQAVYDPDLAVGLRDLGTLLTDQDRPVEAAIAHGEAACIQRRLMASNPVTRELTLAASLRGLADNLPLLGLHDLAGQASEEAVARVVRLTVAKPYAHDDELATAMHSRAIELAQRDRHGEARNAARQAVTIRARLLRDDLNACETRLDKILENRGVWSATGAGARGGPRLNGVGVVREHPDNPPREHTADDVVQRLRPIAKRAVAVRTEGHTDSVGHTRDRLLCFRKLAEATLAESLADTDWLQPALCRLDERAAKLARSLANLSERHATLNERGEALTQIQHAVATFLLLRVARDCRDLARARASLALRLSSVGRHHDAIAASSSALMALSGSAYRTSATMASTLLAFAWVRGVAGVQLEFGLVASRRAIEIFGQLRACQLEAHNASLRAAMELEWGMLRALDRTAESDSARRAASALPRHDLSITRPGVYAELREAVLEPA